MERWYVVKTKPKKEDDVAVILKQASFSVFHPRMKVVANSAQLKPLFPSYIFIHVNMKDPAIHRMIQFTRGVTKILGDLEGPQPVPSFIIETLKERAKDGSIIEQELLLKEGDEVKVKKGILKDLIGMIEKNMTEDGRVRILFKWIAGTMRATLKYRDLEKAA
jgi:transcription antitermination factor NusG